MDRKLTQVERDMWDRYENILNKYHEKHKVKHYDRVSIHNAFPEIKEAFDKCVETMKTTDVVEALKHE